MKKMMVLALTLAMTMLAAAGLCDTLRVGMECNYAPYNWTQSDASENAVAIAAGGYADGYDVRIAKIIADKLGMDLEIVKTEWDGLTPALLSGNIDVIIAGMSPTAERKMTIDFTDSYYDTELTVVVRKDSAFASAKSLADLAGAKITGQMSTFHYDMIDQIEGAVKMPAMETFPTMIVAVSSGAIDGYVADRPGVQELQNPQGSVEFRHLTFRYPDGEYDVLQDISFTIHPGESVGIVGKTGAGKTALVDLLLRTYNVPDGTLFVDGKDVNTLSIHSVRAACAYVPQDNFLFSDTIAHNIGFGVDDASPEMIDHAASLADVRDNIVDFKDGYETVLGERGVTVSGGQKQRISIARALLKDAPILILDDSVSAVDTRTEKIILDNLKSSRANKTTLLIAHRISTVERLDKIIFLDDGKIEAVGPHDELYTSCPKYRRMVDLQRLEDEAGGDDNA